MATIVGELGVEITADSTGLAEEIRVKVEAAVREASTKQIALSVDVSALARQINEGIELAKNTVGKIGLDVELNNASVTALRAKVKLLTEELGKTDPIEPRVDSKTAKADFEKFSKDLSNSLSDLQGKINGGLAAAFRGITQVAKWDTVIVGAANAAQSVIALSGAAGLLPGVLFSVAGALAAVKIGTEGVGQAIKDIGTDKFAADLAKLSPNARGFVTELAALRPALTDLKLDVQDSLFQGFGARLKDMAGNLLPTVRAGLSGFAASLNQTAQGVFAFFSASTVKSDLAATFGTAQASVLNLGAALPAVLSILRDVGVVGSQAFANLTGGVGAAAQRVADFVAQARFSGALANFINDGVAAFRQLFAIIGNVLSIVNTLVGAIGGGGILGLLLQLTTVLKNFLNSAAGTAALQALGTAMQQIAASAGQVLLKLLTSLGQILVDHAPDIEKFAAALGDNLVSAIDALTPVISGLLDAIGAHPELFANIALGAIALASALEIIVPIATAVAALIAAGTVGLVAAIVAAVIAAVVLIILNFDKIKGAIEAALGAIGSFFAFLGTTIANAFGSAVSFVVGIWNGVVAFFVGIGTAIGSAVSSAVTAVGQFFADGFNAVVSFIGGVVTSIVGFFVALPGQILAFIVGLPAQIGAAISQIAFVFGFVLGATLREFIDFPGQVISAVVTLINDIGVWAASVGTAMLTFFVQGVVNVVNFLNAFPGQVIAAVTALVTDIVVWAVNVWLTASIQFEIGVANVINFVTQLPGRVISGVASLAGQIINWAVGVWNNAKNAFSQGVNAVVNFAIQLPGNVINAIGSLGSRLYQVGVDALTGLLNGLKSIASNILGWVKGLVGDILHGFTSGFDSHSPSRETYAIGQDVAAGLANALRDSRQLVSAAAGDLAQAGLDGLSPILNPTVNTAAVANGISSAANGLSTNAVGGVNYTVQQTNVMQQGADVNQFADAVLRNGASALANGASLLGVSQLGVQLGVNPNFVPVSGG